MKRCSRCATVRPLEEFHLCNRGDGRQRWCKDCRREYDHEYHARTKHIRLEQKRAWKKHMAAWTNGLKTGKACADCGGTFHPQAMVWDHLPGTEKVGEVSYLARRIGKERILAEIAKCELVCAN